MASAGRVLIIPKGDYNENSTYEKLDLVKYKGTSWLGKKNATGIEPSKANAEYWQDVFDMELVNNLTTEEEGYALDARQGKVLNDKITTINNNLNQTTGDFIYNADFVQASTKSILKTGKTVSLFVGVKKTDGTVFTSGTLLTIGMIEEGFRPKASQVCVVGFDTVVK